MIRGNVVDFILLHWYDKKVVLPFFGGGRPIDLIWPAFNVADSCITIGVVWLLLSTLFAKKEGGSMK
jgi:lipoprotein signal peptidase